jgi:hypothetical protein
MKGRLIVAAVREKVEIYFNQVVLNYNRGDVRALLDAKLKQAGPLLNSVVNGIDLIGGMADGFLPKNSTSRSVKFMRKYLGLTEEEARLLYALVRCGIAHEGVTKLAIRFFVHYDCRERHVFLYKDHEHCIWLNVTELAYSYLDAVDLIGTEPHSHLFHVPAPSPHDEDLFHAALKQIRTDIDQFCIAAAESASDEREKEAIRRGAVGQTTSSSPFLTEWLSQFTVGPV